jgi:hypothetical protein
MPKVEDSPIRQVSLDSFYGLSEIRKWESQPIPSRPRFLSLPSIKRHLPPKGLCSPFSSSLFLFHPIISHTMSVPDYEKKGDVYDQGVGPADTYVLPDHTYTTENGQVRGLKRQLKNRHIAMISIGGVM